MQGERIRERGPNEGEKGREGKGKLKNEKEAIPAKKKEEEERARGGRLKDMRRTKGKGRQTGVGEENAKK